MLVVSLRFILFLSTLTHQNLAYRWYFIKSNFLWDVRHCKFYLVEYWLLFFYPVCILDHGCGTHISWKQFNPLRCSFKICPVDQHCAQSRSNSSLIMSHKPSVSSAQCRGIQHARQGEVLAWPRVWSGCYF